MESCGGSENDKTAGKPDVGMGRRWELQAEGAESSSGSLARSPPGRVTASAVFSLCPPAGGLDSRKGAPDGPSFPGHRLLENTTLMTRNHRLLCQGPLRNLHCFYFILNYTAMNIIMHDIFVFILLKKFLYYSQRWNSWVKEYKHLKIHVIHVANFLPKMYYFRLCLLNVGEWVFHRTFASIGNSSFHLHRGTRNIQRRGWGWGVGVVGRWILRDSWGRFVISMYDLVWK